MEQKQVERVDMQTWLASFSKKELSVLEAKNPGVGHAAARYLSHSSDIATRELAIYLWETYNNTKSDPLLRIYLSGSQLPLHAAKEDVLKAYEKFFKDNFTGLNVPVEIINQPNGSRQTSADNLVGYDAMSDFSTALRARNTVNTLIAAQLTGGLMTNKPDENDPNQVITQTEPSTEKKVDQPLGYYLEYPLVAMIGIGDYINLNDEANLDYTLRSSVIGDYTRMIRLFAGLFDYDFIYRALDTSAGGSGNDDEKSTQIDTSDNDIDQKLPAGPVPAQPPPSAADKENKKIYKNVYVEKTRMRHHSWKQFKLWWTIKDIDEYVNDIVKATKAIKPDGLIFIISSHGNTGVITDSMGNNYELENIFKKFTNTPDGCPKLKHRPKLFMMDMCRGERTPYSEAFYKLVGAPATVVPVLHPSNQVNQFNQHQNQVNNSNGSNDSNDNNGTGNNNNQITQRPAVLRGPIRGYLQNDNFAFLFSTALGYTSLNDTDGGYMIKSIYNVLTSFYHGEEGIDIETFPLSSLVPYIRTESLRLVRGEKRKWQMTKEEKKRKKNVPGAQVVEYIERTRNYIVFTTIKSRQQSSAN